MKKVFLASIAALAFLTGEVAAEKMALILDPYVPVFRERKPGAELLVMAAKGKKYQVEKVGEHWVEVYVPPNNEKGWIELGVESPKVKIIEESSIMDMAGNFVIWIVLLAVLGGGFFVLRFLQQANRKKALETADAAPGR